MIVDIIFLLLDFTFISFVIIIFYRFIILFLTSSTLGKSLLSCTLIPPSESRNYIIYEPAAYFLIILSLINRFDSTIFALSPSLNFCAIMYLDLLLIYFFPQYGHLTILIIHTIDAIRTIIPIYLSMWHIYFLNTYSVATLKKQ